MNCLEITSTQNDLVKYCVKLQNSKFRKLEKKILLDGDKTIEGLICDNVEFEYIFLKKENNRKEIRAKNIVFVNDEILKKITTTKTPSNFAGIIKEKQIDVEIFKSLKKIALFENIKDAGNLGTIIRSAAAFGMEGIILFGDCVDLYNPKTIRSSAQNMFKIPIISTKDYEFIKDLKHSHKFISTVVEGGKDFFRYRFKDKFVLMFGSEADGLSERLDKLSDERLSFIMENSVESLNLAICASIAFSFIKLNKSFIGNLT